MPSPQIADAFRPNKSSGSLVDPDDGCVNGRIPCEERSLPPRGYPRVPDGSGLTRCSAITEEQVDVSSSGVEVGIHHFEVATGGGVPPIRRTDETEPHWDSSHAGGMRPPADITERGP